MSAYQEVLKGNSVGYTIAREFYGWVKLTKYEGETMAPCVVRLAEMIDRYIK